MGSSDARQRRANEAPGMGAQMIDDDFKQKIRDGIGELFVHELLPKDA